MKFMSAFLTRGGTLKKEEGLALEWEPFCHVLVGDGQNRDRRFSRIPVGKRYADNLKGQSRVTSGSFMRTREKNTLLLIEEHPDPYPRLGVLLYAQPGFRGVSEIRADKDVLARGQIWDSPNGNIGVGEVALVLMRPGDKIEVFRAGRPALDLPERKHWDGLYGAPPNIVVFLDEELNLHAMSKDDEALEEEAVKEEVRGDLL